MSNDLVESPGRRRLVVLVVVFVALLAVAGIVRPKSGSAEPAPETGAPDGPMEEAADAAGDLTPEAFAAMTEKVSRSAGPSNDVTARDLFAFAPSAAVDPTPVTRPAVPESQPESRPIETRPSSPPEPVATPADVAAIDGLILRGFVRGGISGTTAVTNRGRLKIGDLVPSSRWRVDTIDAAQVTLRLGADSRVLTLKPSGKTATSH